MQSLGSGTMLRAFLGVIRRRRRRILAWTAVAVACALVGATLTAYLQVHKVVSEIHHVTVKPVELGKRPPVYSTTSMNILVFGSDSRAGLDRHMQVVLRTGNDTQGGNNTDTIMILHISPGRHLVTAMSIPRDTMVPYYQCAPGPGYPGQQADSSAYERINALLAAGGPGCLWKTVEQQTGIHIDHFLELGMAGFVNVVNDLGGVNVCVPFNVNDPVSGLALPAGKTHIDGVQALAFWRTREDLGLGSDLQRIQRDQFMSAQVVKGIMQTGLLGDPLRLWNVLSVMAPNLTIDSGMSATDLLHLGESLHGLTAKDVQFVTAPVVPWPADPNATVGFAQPTATAMFSAIAHDVTIPKAVKSATSANPSSAATAPALAASPSAATGSAEVAASATASPSAGATATAS